MRITWVTLAALACGEIDDPNDYAEARAEAECSRIEQCALGFFESEYRDREDCVDERADDLDEQNDNLDDAGCDYVADEAARCVSRVRGLSCEEWAENESYIACDLVWNCLED